MVTRPRRLRHAEPVVDLQRALPVVAGTALLEIVSPGDGIDDLGMTPTKSVLR